MYRRAWEVILPTVVEEGFPETNWAAVYGPLGTVIANLHRVGSIRGVTPRAAFGLSAPIGSMKG